MSKYDTLATWLGYAVALNLGLVLAVAVAGFLLWVLGLIGRDLYLKLTNVYSLTVISYWLKRLEREGTHTFERARKDAIDAGREGEHG